MINEKNNFFLESSNQIKKDTQHPDHDLIAEKILICKAATTEQLGSPNVYQAAKFLYESLYNPEIIKESIAPNKKYPNRMNILMSSLSTKSHAIPSLEEFISKVRHAMTREADYSKCFSEEAKNQFFEVMNKSELTIIWTDGDSLGVPELNLPGSHEQIYRINSAKFFNQIRHEVAKQKGLDHKEVLKIIAIEEKTKSIPQIIDEFVKRKIEKIIIIEDRIKNLGIATRKIKEIKETLKVFPVWVKQGQYGNIIENIDNEEFLKTYHAINNISELSSLLEKNNIFKDNTKIGTIFDMDGVLSNDDLRKSIQIEAVIKALQEKKWI